MNAHQSGLMYSHTHDCLYIGFSGQKNPSRNPANPPISAGDLQVVCCVFSRGLAPFQWGGFMSRLPCQILHQRSDVTSISQCEFRCECPLTIHVNSMVFTQILHRNLCKKPQCEHSLALFNIHRTITSLLWLHCFLTRNKVVGDHHKKSNPAEWWNGANPCLKEPRNSQLHL